MKYLLLLVTLISSLASMKADGEIPGAPQKTPILLTNATVHVGNGEKILNASVLFDNGLILAVGSDVTAPDNATVIDCSGKMVYPGFITPESSIGLVEIGAVRATRDNAETGPINPNVRAETAYNPDSEIIPTVRSNGVLIANVAPESGLLSGQSSLMRLDGWNREDIAISPRSGMILNWPSMLIINAWWMEKTPEEQKKKTAEDIANIHQYFQEAYTYARGAEVGLDTTKKDIRYEAMRSIFDGSLPLIIHASSQLQIESALDLTDQYPIKVIISGGTEAIEVAKRLKKNKVPVILQQVHSLPAREEDPYDQSYTLPARMMQAGIHFCLSADGFWRQRDLPFQAGTAMAFGLSEADAVRSISLSAAEIFGVDNRYGSLEKGKSATLFISAGDALDSKGNVLERAWIDGREVDLDNRHKRLSNKYRERAKR